MNPIAAIVGLFQLIPTLLVCFMIINYIPAVDYAADQAKDGNIEPAVDLIDDMTRDLVNLTIDEMEDAATDEIIDLIPSD